MTMQATDIVKDPLLTSVLEASDRARQQCLSLLDFLDSNRSYTRSTNSDPTELSPDEKSFKLGVSKQQKRLYACLAQLRGLNRDAVLEVRATKQVTADGRAEVDALHLQLQNLYYEMRHLTGEIAACEDYDHPYAHLPLISEEDYLSSHPEHQSLSSHDLMIARINHEHAERLALESKRQELLKTKKELIAENKKRKEKLEGLDRDVEKFLDGSKPIQDTLKVDI